jgi:hypothetical protein
VGESQSLEEEGLVNAVEGLFIKKIDFDSTCVSPSPAHSISTFFAILLCSPERCW